MNNRSRQTIGKPGITNELTDINTNVMIVARQLNRLLNDNFGESAVQKIIAYYRVSTAKQGRSGLGMEGQQAAVDAFASRRGCEVLASYTEVESGKLADRPQLSKALAHAKRSKATLVVAKLDRLARNVAFLSHLMESGVDFIAIDLEHANRLTIHILSAVAEGEAKAISDRTKAALQAAKARGTELGSARPGHWEGREAARLNGLAKARKESAKVRTEAAAEAYVDLLPTMQQLRSEGATFKEIADKLSEQGHTTRRGNSWNGVQVMRVLSRVK
jgi:DNA invertase Pin-like site-specific DNA recombinase